jgi:hypothetical protein
MKNIRLIITASLIGLIISCKPSGNSTITTTLKKNEYIGTILFKELKAPQKGSTPEKHLFFHTESAEYLIKISDGYVTKEKLLEFENKIIKVKGEIKRGIIKQEESGSFVNQKTSTKAINDEYIAIYKVYKKNRLPK